MRGEIAGCPRPEEGWCLGTEFVEQVGELCSLNGVEEHSRHAGSVAKPATASRLPERGRMPSTYATRTQTTHTTVEMAAVDQAKIRLPDRLGRGITPTTRNDADRRGSVLAGQYRFCRSRLTQSPAAAISSGDGDLAAEAHLLRAAALIELGAPAGRAELSTYISLAEGLGHARGRWGALTRRATLAQLAGRADEAAQLGEEALQLGRDR